MATKVVLGQTIDITLTDYARLAATVNGCQYTADHWEALEERLKKALTIARTERAIPVIVDYERHIQRAVLRGEKATDSSTFLFTLDDGSKKAIKNDKIRYVSRGEEMTDDQIDEQNRLDKLAQVALDAARTYRYSIEKKYSAFSTLLDEAAEADVKAGIEPPHAAAPIE